GCRPQEEQPIQRRRHQRQEQQVRNNPTGTRLGPAEAETKAWQLELRGEPASFLFEEFGSTTQAWESLKCRHKGDTWGSLVIENNHVV
ncbi:hypothetical protein P7K49_007482, partial [Saguinus oedipus]